ncbi:MAG: hypothetical protein IJJ70_08855 [Treponema sp.]|nr:hypothetical protein [Treponema sp.]
MKKFRKTIELIGSLFLILGAAGLLFSCSDGDDGNKGGSDSTKKDSVTYAISFNEDTSALKVDVGETITLTVKESVGTWSYDKDNSSSQYIDVEEVKEGTKLTGLKITGTAIADTDIASTAATLSLFVSEDETGNSDQTLTVNVWGLYDLAVSLDSAVAANAASVSVYYGHSDNNVFETVEAVYTPGATTATAKLKKSLANDSKWFNNISATVKDSSGNTIETMVSGDNYFCYSTSTYTLTIVSAVSSKTFTLNFEGFEIPGGTVTGLKFSNTWYQTNSEWTEETTFTPEITVAQDGKSASFEVSKASLTSANEFYIDFTGLVIQDSSSNTITLTTGNTKSSQWYSYGGDEWSATLTVVSLTDADYTKTLADSISLPSGTNSSAPVLLKEDLTMPESVSAFKIVYTAGENDIVTAGTSWITLYSGSDWANPTKLVNAWESGFDATASSFTVYITDSSAVSAFKAGNFYIAADSASYTGKITITYAD